MPPAPAVSRVQPPGRSPATAAPVGHKDFFRRRDPRLPFDSVTEGAHRGFITTNESAVRYELLMRTADAAREAGAPGSGHQLDGLP